jgi:inner membrane protein
MDSLTQIVLGGAVAAACVVPAHRRRAIVTGAVLGTVPDLDVVPLSMLDIDPILNMTWHRGPSHSLFVLAAFGLLVWLAARRWWPIVRESPTRWFAAIELALLTHPLLDAFTTYGTQLFWPLPVAPTMISSIFIIDPLYTLPLLVAFVGVLWLGGHPRARTFIVTALLVSSAYLGWSLLAKTMVERAAHVALVEQGLGDAPRFSVPMPFNTLLWRVVAMTDEGFVEGERSLVADHGAMRFKGYTSEKQVLASVATESAGVRRLEWFAHGFLKGTVRDGRLFVSDLRMGAEPDYSFTFAVAEAKGDSWHPIRAEQMRWPWQARDRLVEMWSRIWHESPPEPTAARAISPDPS